MTAFDTAFELSASELFATFGEAAVYIPRSGRERTITVIVQRMAIDVVNGLDNVIGPRLVVRAFVDPENEDYGGIDPERINTGGDKLRIAWVKEGETEDRTISRVIHVSGGILFFEVV